MLYEEARVYLDHVSKYGSVLGLDSIKSLLGELGNPQDDLKFIHIAGTNGKGSILASLSCILQEAGYKVGRYLSPTVIDYMERFQIDQKWMAEDELASFVEKVKEASENVQEKYGLSPTAFEIETAISFLYYKKHNCDYVMLEAGLGGALDATNVVKNTVLCVFASISMDHLGVLGNTLEEIAETKAGIIKAGASVVTTYQKESVLNILKEHARQAGCDFKETDTSQIIIEKECLTGQQFSYKEFKNINLSLLGRYQIENAAATLEAVDVLKQKGIHIPEKAVRKGLETVVWPGRFQLIDDDPVMIVDGAHNEDAAKRLAENINIYLPNKKITAVMGVFKDKEYRKIIDITAPYLDKVYTVDLPNKERTLPKEELKIELINAGITAKEAQSIPAAVDLAKGSAGEDGVVLVFGSLSYLGEVIRMKQKNACFGKEV